MDNILELLSLYNDEKNKLKKKELLNEILKLVNNKKELLNKKLTTLQENEKRNF